MSELIALVFKMYMKVIVKRSFSGSGKFKEHVSSEGFLLSHTRHNGLIADCISLSNANNFIFINICDT